MHELAFGIVICFGSEEFLHIYSILHIDASLHSPTTRHASASPTAFLPPFAPVDLRAFPTFESFLARFPVPLPPPPLLPEGSEVGRCSGSWESGWDRDTNRCSPAAPLPVDT